MSKEIDYDSPEYKALYEEARTELDAAIKAFVAKVDSPDQYVLGWDMNFFYTSPNLERTHQTGVGGHCSVDLNIVERRGLIEIARDRVIGYFRS